MYVRPIDLSFIHKMFRVLSTLFDTLAINMVTQQFPDTCSAAPETSQCVTGNKSATEFHRNDVAFQTAGSGIIKALMWHRWQCNRLPLCHIGR
jgi:hypothetical protein